MQLVTAWSDISSFTQRIPAWSHHNQKRRVQLRSLLQMIEQQFQAQVDEHHLRRVRLIES